MILEGETAKAMVLVEPKRFTSTRLPMANMPTGAWLAVEATGISGVEVQAWAGDSRTMQYPLILGREVVGRIASTMSDFDIPIGTRVVVEPTIRCNTCSRCSNNLSSCTMRKPVNAYGQIPSTEKPGLWGGFAEFMYLDPNTRLHVLSDNIPAVVGTFAHPLAAGFSWAVETPNLLPGENILIFGPGPRGLSALVAAKQAGAAWVGITGLSHDTDRLALAIELGADMTVFADQEDVAGAVADSLGARPDVVLDVTTNDTEAVLLGLDLVRAGGRLVFASTKGTRAVNQLFSDVIVLKELSILGAYGASSASYEWATRQLVDDPRLDSMVSHEFPLSEADRAVQATAGLLGREELISVAVAF